MIHDEALTPDDLREAKLRSLPRPAGLDAPISALYGAGPRLAASAADNRLCPSHRERTGRMTCLRWTLALAGLAAATDLRAQPLVPFNPYVSGTGFLYGRAEWLERLEPAEGGSTMAQSVTWTEWKPKPSRTRSRRCQFRQWRA